MAHKFPPWHRAILVPFWTLQLFFLVAIIGMLVLASAVLRKYYDTSLDNSYGGLSDADLDNAYHLATKIVVPVWCSLSAICMIITISEIVLLTRRKLTPRKFVILNVVKSTIWTGLFILDIISWARAAGDAVTASGVIVELGIVLSFWIPLVYGGIIYHKSRKQKKAYSPVAPSGAGHDTSYQSQLHQPVHQDVETGGPPPYQGQFSGTTGAYDPYKPGQHNYGDVGLAHPSPGLMSPAVPQVRVEHHHNNVYEMDTRRNLS